MFEDYSYGKTERPVTWSGVIFDTFIQPIKKKKKIMFNQTISFMCPTPWVW